MQLSFCYLILHLLNLLLRRLFSLILPMLPLYHLLDGFSQESLSERACVELPSLILELTTS